MGTIIQSTSREDRTMKIFLISCLLLATLDLSSGFLKKLWKKEEECDIIWEEHYQPHCTTSYQQHCEQKYSDQCHTEYTEECWDEHEDVCRTHPECHTTYVDHCEPVYKKQCYGGGKKKGKKFKREVAEELLHSEEEDEDLEVIKNMSTAELLDIIAEAEKEDISNKEKRDIASKIHKLFKKGKKEECEAVHHGEHCEKVPLDNCHDVEKCTKEVRRECKKVPHEKCWQEPHEHCTDHPQEHCETVKVKVARRHCREGKGKKEKLWEKLFGKKLKKDGKKGKDGNKGGGNGGYNNNGGLLDISIF